MLSEVEKEMGETDRFVAAAALICGTLNLAGLPCLCEAVLAPKAETERDVALPSAEIAALTTTYFRLLTALLPNPTCG